MTDRRYTTVHTYKKDEARNGNKENSRKKEKKVKEKLKKVKDR